MELVTASSISWPTFPMSHMLRGLQAWGCAYPSHHFTCFWRYSSFHGSASRLRLDRLLSSCGGAKLCHRHPRHHDRSLRIGAAAKEPSASVLPAP
ncbi:unnamed protein product [Linum trigynum]|uniref:Uncharacterized protein n=1 Tax=Linum trigynum TaxID=586398 RepID=A0AAV2EV46_9ROSI